MKKILQNPKEHKQNDKTKIGPMVDSGTHN